MFGFYKWFTIREQEHSYSRWLQSTCQHKSDTDAQQFIDMVEASRLKQWIDFLTHKQGNTLDLITTELATEIQIKNVYCGPYILDHCIITCTCNIPKTKMKTKQIKYRDFKKVDIVEMINDMNFDSINLVSENLEEILSEFKSCVSESLDKLAPEKWSKAPFRDSCPWYNQELQVLKRSVQNRKRIWHKYEQDHQWHAYREHCSKYTKILRTSRMMYTQNES